MAFTTAAANCVKWCVNWRGRASRSEFWYFFLIFLAVGAVAMGLNFLPLIICYFVLLVPLISVGVRRLHDTGHAGGWWWLAFFAWGLIVLFVFWSQRSQPHANRYGPPPLGAREEELLG